MRSYTKNEPAKCSSKHPRQVIIKCNVFSITRPLNLELMLQADVGSSSRSGRNRGAAAEADAIGQREQQLKRTQAASMQQQLKRAQSGSSSWKDHVDFGVKGK